MMFFFCCFAGIFWFGTPVEWIWKPGMVLYRSFGNFMPTRWEGACYYCSSDTWIPAWSLPWSFTCWNLTNQRKIFVLLHYNHICLDLGTPWFNIALISLQTAYNLLQYEVSSMVFPIILKDSAKNNIIYHLWRVNPNLVLRGFMDECTADLNSLLRVVDICQELKVKVHHAHPMTTTVQFIWKIVKCYCCHFSCIIALHFSHRLSIEMFNAIYYEYVIYCIWVWLDGWSMEFM